MHFFGSSMKLSKLYIVSFQGGLTMLNLELMTTRNKPYFDVLVILRCPLSFISFLEIIMALSNIIGS
jgi:hypothetical protein